MINRALIESGDVIEEPKPDIWIVQMAYDGVIADAGYYYSEKECEDAIRDLDCTDGIREGLYALRILGCPEIK